MKNPSGNKLDKLVFGMFDQMVEGADKYVTEQGSTWLIFTDEKRWVIEFTKDKTLWFNYNVFQNELDLIGKDCTEERDLIKNWFESRFLNKTKVDETLDNAANMIHHIEDAIQEGVKHTIDIETRNKFIVEDTIQNGVKRTLFDNSDQRQKVEVTIENGVKEINKSGNIHVKYVEDIIQNGVKETRFQKSSNLYRIEDTRTLWGKSGDEGVVEYIIQEGVKECNWRRVDNFPDFENRVIENSVKETKENRLLRTINVISTIKNGVKETKESMLESSEQIDHQVTNYEITESINDAIENGVKETKEISNISLMSEMFKVKAKQTIRDGVKEMQPLPAQDGNRDWGLYYHRQQDRTKPHTEYVKEVIEDSYNHRGRIEGIIRNTDKDGI